MPVTKAKKAEILKELEGKFSKAKAIYFAGNLGLPVKKVGDLRKKLNKGGLEMVVAKKTLFAIAAKNSNLTLSDEVLEGAVSATFSYEDVISPARMLYEFSKENENLQILGGVVDGKMISKIEAKYLATLPPREQLLAKLLGSMKAPIASFNSVLSGVMRSFVYSLKAVHDKKAAN